jgi:hypothetical protein
LERDLVAALVISAVGITLLFLALALFYGLLVLLAAVFKGQASAGVGGPEPAGQEPESADAMLQAAAIGVALARADAERPPSLDLVPSGEAAPGSHSVSPWWALHHQRQVTQKPGSRRVP